GSLGQLEAVGERLAAITGVCPPPVPSHPALLLAAGDHGRRGHVTSPTSARPTAKRTTRSRGKSVRPTEKINPSRNSRGPTSGASRPHTSFATSSATHPSV
ncbi:MAG: nicotinate-nucleotide--dimethylbenzimidazole phosphoribosyltransferase, partial [Gemmatimonadetes bacterium]|nr:nicotinate-nucleotide--dimethylbenzimidazole phosphoribosyltransferase [Gemmatimonadota bacterium]